MEKKTIQQSKINSIKTRFPKVKYQEIHDLKIITFINQNQKPCLYIWKGGQKDPFVKYYYHTHEQRDVAMQRYIELADARLKEKLELRER